MKNRQTSLRRTFCIGRSIMSDRTSKPQRTEDTISLNETRQFLVAKVKKSPIALQPMKGLRRNDDDMEH
ncbi:MAG: hypothetical protein JWQ96_2516 [Segetibacter sp.]|nr:hypothetical protein [Segetibacter sp.]